MTLHLMVRRRIRGAPERVFAAWTEPAQLVRWWGPPGVSCPTAEVDLRVGGWFRLENRLPDGASLWITGQFQEVERPSRLVYSWAHEPLEASTAWTRVTVRFEPRDDGTEVVVVHEQFATQEAHEAHLGGWEGCIDGLEKLLFEAHGGPPTAR